MKAMVLKKFGGIENFVLEDVSKPQVKAGEVSVRVIAIGLDPIDVKTRRGGGVASGYEGDAPMVLGWSISGIVDRVGPGVENFSAGDAVFGTVNFPGRGGAYAEYVVAPAGQLARKPSGISFTDAAGATLAALTAWQALVDRGHVKQGDKVLVHGAAGGVGSFAVQIAKFFGACVIGTASGEDIGCVKQLGADEVIDYKNQRFEEITSGFDLILDTIGGENFVRSLKVLKPEGVIVLLPSDKKDEAEKVMQDRYIRNYYHILVHPNGREMQKIASLLGTEDLKVRIGKVFPFRQLPEAHAALENRKVRGKIVVSLADLGGEMSVC